jgi:flavin-dependent dehydrogenase
MTTSEKLTDISCDVAIVGGGLAGMTLALQLKRASPGLDIVVLERNSFPPPAAAHKVGESTVEIGAHYLSNVLGLETLLETTQLRKFGLRFFFGAGKHRDLAAADELGASDFLPIISYQLDRGRLEADLAALLLTNGVRLLTGCLVRQVALASAAGLHEIKVSQAQESWALKCRWLVDAASRFGLLKRHMGLQKPSPHDINAAWCRLDTSIDIDSWSEKSAWRDRCNGVPRRLSTNHLMGSGYWAWIIPLVDGRTSIGLVADSGQYPLDSYNNFDKLLSWLSAEQPLLAENLAASRESLMDFKFLRHFSHDSKKVWSGDRWAMTGESGVFADPYYSPGTDFIAISNTFICHLITQERTQALCQFHAGIYQNMYKSFFSSTMSLYLQQYPGFGDTRLMVLKSTWDYAYYWLVLAWLFFRGVMTDIAFIQSIEPELGKIRLLNESLQAAFRLRAARKYNAPGQGRFFDQVEIPILADSNAQLLRPTGNLKREFKENCNRLEALAQQLLDILEQKTSGSHGQNSLLGDLSSRLD